MAEQGGCDPRVEQDRHLARRDFYWIEPGDGALPGALADCGGILQIGGEARAVPGIVALHARSLPATTLAEQL